MKFILLTLSLVGTFGTLARGAAASMEEVSYNDLVSELAQKRQIREIKTVDYDRLLHLSLLTSTADARVQSGNGHEQMNGFQVFWGQTLSPQVFAGFLARGWILAGSEPDHRTIGEIDLTVRKNFPAWNENYLAEAGFGFGARYLNLTSDAEHYAELNPNILLITALKRKLGAGTAIGIEGSLDSTLNQSSRDRTQIAAGLRLETRY